MKSTTNVLTIFVIILVATPALGSEEGRYQGFIHPDGNGLYILDTQEGHVWNLEISELKYLGQCRSGEVGEMINKPPAKEETEEGKTSFEMLLKSYEEWNKE